VKDRYLFLFNDLLVIAKPIIPHGITATLDMKFAVKSVVALDKLAVSGLHDETSSEGARHPIVQKFIQQFSQDPVTACTYLVERSKPRVDQATLASLIFKTHELDKSQIGNLLALPTSNVLLRSFVDRFHFGSVPIDNALRMFLLSIRLPTEAGASEALLRGFAHGYYEANRSIVAYDGQLAVELVLAIMQLNDALHGGFQLGFAFPNHAITREDFVSAFQSKDPHGRVPDGRLSEIYTAIRETRLQQALETDMEKSLARHVVLSPAKLPSKLTYNVWSEMMTVRIPMADPDLQIRLLSEGLEFDPPVLNFLKTSEASFRVKGTSLGVRSILFDRTGQNA
jgi:Sec7-like guanine-nucleotide exchange factor